MHRHLGRGLAFPIRLNRRGGLAMTGGQTRIEEAIGIVLRTGLGERVMRSDFGAEVRALLFEPATPATAARLAEAIRDALLRWEPRIDLLDVAVTRDPAVEARFLASITYRVRANNAVLNQVYPFYLREGAGER